MKDAEIRRKIKTGAGASVRKNVTLRIHAFGAEVEAEAVAEAKEGSVVMVVEKTGSNE